MPRERDGTRVRYTSGSHSVHSARGAEGQPNTPFTNSCGRTDDRSVRVLILGICAHVTLCGKKGLGRCDRMRMLRWGEYSGLLG